MYTQFFGNYLFSKGYVTKEQLIPALMRQPKDTVHIGTLALYSGYMSANEIEYIRQLQIEQGRKFGELAIEHGYLTSEKVLELLNAQKPNFLVLGQILIEDGVFTYEQFENILTDYRSQHEFLDMELNEDNKDDIKRLLNSFSLLSETAIPEFGKTYLELLLNNFVRFIGDDFTALPPDNCTEFPMECCVSQSINGGYVVNTYLCMDKATATEFACRYTDEYFPEFDEYVDASIEDFVNLHNGLFIVNASNESSNELSLGIIERNDDIILNFENPAYYFPIYYPFGIIHFIMEIVSLD